MIRNFSTKYISEGVNLPYGVPIASGTRWEPYNANNGTTLQLYRSLQGDQYFIKHMGILRLDGGTKLIKNISRNMLLSWLNGKHFLVSSRPGHISSRDLAFTVTIKVFFAIFANFVNGLLNYNYISKFLLVLRV